MKTAERGRRVWVESVPVSWPDRVRVVDSAGTTHELTGGPYCIFEAADGSGRLGVGGAWVAELSPGRHLVRFRDGTELTVALDSPHQWERAGVAA